MAMPPFPPNLDPSRYVAPPPPPRRPRPSGWWFVLGGGLLVVAVAVGITLFVMSCRQLIAGLRIFGPDMRVSDSP